MKFSAGRAAGRTGLALAPGGVKPATGLALGGAATVGTELLGGAPAGGDSDGANAASGPPGSGPLLSMVAASGSTARFETGPPLFAGAAAGAGPDAAAGAGAAAGANAAAGGASMRFPHAPQNRAPSSIWVPQCGQCCIRPSPSS